MSRLPRQAEEGRHQLPPGNFVQRALAAQGAARALTLKARQPGRSRHALGQQDHHLHNQPASSPPAAAEAQERPERAFDRHHSIVPKGILRHDGRHRPPDLPQGLLAGDLGFGFSQHRRPTLRSIVLESLGRMDGDGRPGSALCDEIALRMLMRTYLGVARGSATHRELEEQFNAMAPNGFALERRSAAEGGFREDPQQAGRAGDRSRRER